ncbi:MAG: formate C-acetyltransferase/glycerol dehydratase family glycyl radical enzyme [Candidatus Lokiarchaeia archaeon]
MKPIASKEKIRNVGMSRSEKLKKRLLSLPKEVCIERARLITESYKETEGETVIIRRAKALRRILSDIPVNIWSDELIVGSITSRELGAGIYPETIGGWLDGELDQLDKRVPNPFLIRPEEIEKLRKEVFPYWSDKNILNLTLLTWPKDITDIHFTGQAFVIPELAGFGHIVLNHEKVLKEGLEGIIKEADGYLAETQDPVKRDFYKAVKIACQAVIDFANRYAEKAENLSLNQKDEGKRKELQNIAKICRRVPAKPAESFQEALQAIYFTQIAAQIEDYEASISIGRIDRLLYPYYKSDVEKGKISREDARILLECFFLKLSSVIPLWNSLTTQYFGGLPVYTNVIIGGVDEKGNDVTNEVSYLALEARKKSHIQPNFGVRIHEKTPPEFLEKVSEAVVSGETNLYFQNDAKTIPALVSEGISREDALNYAINGCVEVGIPGKSFTSGDAGLFNLAFALELALNRGIKNGVKIGVETKDPREFKSMEDLMESFKEQVNFLASKFIEGINLMDKLLAEQRPIPFISSLTEGCLQSGRDVTQGGAIYNSSGIQIVGVATVADSLAAIDKLVFKEKKINMGILLEALANDFNNQENLRQLLRKTPKYGNDDEADMYAQKCVEIWHDAIKDYRNYRGGKFWAGAYSATTHVPFGLLTASLPNGRKAGEPLSVGISPSQGMANSGPTAVLKSASKIDYTLTPNGVALNLEFNPGYFRGKEGVKNFAALLKGFFSLGGMHVQFNFVGKETLMAAKKNPEKYKDLLVRVAGFSAAFVDLDPQVQDEIISRTEF